MSDAVTAAGIEWENRSDPANLDRWGVPDLVVVGQPDAARRTSSSQAVRRARHPCVSEIEFYASARRRPHAAHRLRNARQDHDVSACWCTSSSAPDMDPGLPARIDIARPRRHVAPGDRAVRLRGRRIHVGALGPAPEVPAHAAARCLRHAPRAGSSRRVRRPSTRIARRLSSWPRRCRRRACWRSAPMIPECLALREAAQPVVVTYGTNPASDWRIVERATTSTACSSSRWSGMTAPPLRGPCSPSRDSTTRRTHARR